MLSSTSVISPIIAMPSGPLHESPSRACVRACVRVCMFVCEWVGVAACACARIIMHECE